VRVRGKGVPSSRRPRRSVVTFAATCERSRLRAGGCYAAPLHSCKYRWLQARDLDPVLPQTTLFCVSAARWCSDPDGCSWWRRPLPCRIPADAPGVLQRRRVGYSFELSRRDAVRSTARAVVLPLRHGIRSLTLFSNPVMTDHTEITVFPSSISRPCQNGRESGEGKRDPHERHVPSRES
jgi:hypothetical protein